MENPRNQISDVRVDKFQNSVDFQCWKLNFGVPKTFPDVPNKFMYQDAGFGRGSAYHKDVEQLPVDWERGILFHCKSVLHLEILLNHSRNEFFPATLVFVK